MTRTYPRKRRTWPIAAAAGEHGRLTVKKTDKGLELTGDCTWKLDG